MKKISRLIAILLILLMLGTLSVSCKKKDDEEEGVVGIEDEAGTENSGDSGDKDNAGANKNDKNNKNDKETSGGNSVKEEADKKQEAIQNGTSHGEGNGAYVEDEDGNIISTGSHETDDEDRILGAVTNDNGFIPDEEQGLEKSERYATEQSKYDFDKNPLINRDRQVNRNALPSFDINETGFVRAGTKLKDLKGKKLEFFTADNFAAWSYRNAKGETIDEWT